MTVIEKAPRLVAAATDGSGDRSMPLDFNGMSVAPSGSHAVLSVSSRPFGEKVVVDLVDVDFSKDGVDAGSPMAKPLAETSWLTGRPMARMPLGRSSAMLEPFLSTRSSLDA